jgi:pimeloyl-ACP methyl ester carboxylesterase
VFIPTIKKTITVYEYGYSKKKVLLVHGWSGRGTQFYKIADKLLENRHMIISFDAPAHGLSSGKSSMMSEFNDIIRFLDQQYNGFDAAIGHSLGAMALLQNSAQDLELKKLISIAATNDINEIIQKFLIGVDLNPNLYFRFKKQFKKTYKKDLNQYNGVRLAEKISIPTLIIHDSKDLPANVSSAYKIRQSLSHGELLVTHGFGHTRILTNDLIVNRITEFIIQNR